MSTTQRCGTGVFVGKRKRTLMKIGACLLTTFCVGMLALAVAERVQDAADRSH